MGKKLASVSFMAILGVVLFPLPSQAQRGFVMGGGHGMRAGSHVPRSTPHQGGFLRGSHRHHRGFNNGYLPYLYPDYYSDYYPEEAPTEAQPPQVVVVERNQQRAEAPAPPAPPPESLMLELRGNHWVRVTDSGQVMTGSQAGKKGSANAGDVRTITPAEQASAEPVRELPPAVLVFRDGHRVEIHSYTIVGGAVYTSNGYGERGSWTKKVPIAELDVPATLQLNRERGTNFSFPSNPHVIAIRP